MPDQRRSPRLRVDLPAAYRSPSLHVDGRVVNISQGGIYFSAELLDQSGCTARVSLTIPERPEPLELVGDVVWTGEGDDLGDLPAGMGIRFRDVPLVDRILLANFMINRMYA